MSSTPAESRPILAVDTAARRWLIGAWVSVALIPVLIVLAFVIGEGLATIVLAGDETNLPLAALVGLPAVGLMLVAPIAAIVCGARARQLGRRAATIPLIIGAIAAAWATVSTVLSLLLSAAFGA